MIPFSGVRISWLIVARKRLLASLACSGALLRLLQRHGRREELVDGVLEALVRAQHGALALRRHLLGRLGDSGDLADLPLGPRQFLLETMGFVGRFLHLPSTRETQVSLWNVLVCPPFNGAISPKT